MVNGDTGLMKQRNWAQMGASFLSVSFCLDVTHLVT